MPTASQWFLRSQYWKPQQTLAKLFDFYRLLVQLTEQAVISTQQSWASLCLTPGGPRGESSLPALKRGLQHELLTEKLMQKVKLSRDIRCSGTWKDLTCVLFSLLQPGLFLPVKISAALHFSSTPYFPIFPSSFQAQVPSSHCLSTVFSEILLALLTSSLLTHISFKNVGHLSPVLSVIFCTLQTLF